MGIRLSSSASVNASNAVFYISSDEQKAKYPIRRVVNRSRSFQEEKINQTGSVSRRFSLQTQGQLPACSCYSENNEQKTHLASEGITDSLLLLRTELEKRKSLNSELSWTSKLSRRFVSGLKPRPRGTSTLGKKPANWNFWKRRSRMGEYSKNLEVNAAPLAEASGSDSSRNRVIDSGASSDSDTSDFHDFQTTQGDIQIVPVENPRTPIIDLSSFNPEDYPVEDYEERARQERAREMAEGVDPPPGFRPGTSSTDLSVGMLAEIHLNNLTTLFHNSLTMGLPSFDTLTHISTDLRLLAAQHGINVLQSVHSHRTYAHTQIDYIHCLVPDLYEITRCSFYWGKMDRYEAEGLLDNKPDGTFLLRDSAQEEYLFSVSFRRYSRSLHARIEQWNHKFSFDSHDPGVFASPTVCGLMEHYKDPSCCMFFEPMLTIPLHRTFVFSLQHMCRAVICSATTYDGISCLQLPRSLKVYLKEYHYRQRIRVRRLDIE